MDESQDHFDKILYEGITQTHPFCWHIPQWLPPLVHGVEGTDSSA